MKRKIFIFTSLLLLSATIIGCASREEKRNSFLRKGIELYQAGEYEKAILEFKNAIQLDSEFPKSYFYLGKAYLRTENPESAEGAFAKALLLDPDLDEARLVLSEVLVINEKAAGALEQITPFLKDNPNHAHGLLIAAQAYLVQGKAREAIEWLEKISPNKRGKEVLHTFASAYNIIGNTDKVIEYLERYQEAAPEDPSSYFALRRLYTEQDDLGEAESQIRRLIQGNPGNTEYPVLLFQFLLETGQEERAVNELERLISEHRSENAYKLAYADYLFTKKELEKASTILGDAVQNDPMSWPARSLLVRSYRLRDKAQDALKTLNAFLAADPSKGKAEAHVEKARILLELDRLKEAYEQCLLALRLDPGNGLVYLLRGKIYLKKEEADQAITELRQAVDLTPSEPEAHLLLAQTLANSGNPAVAIEALKKGLQHLPGNVDLTMALADAYKAEEEWKYALETVDAGLEKHPGHLRLLLEKGRLLSFMDKINRAEKTFETIIEVYPDKPSGYIGLGSLKRSSGDYEKAIDLFKKAAELDGTNDEARSLLIEVYMETGRLDDAEAFCRTMLEENPEDGTAHYLAGRFYARTNNPEMALRYLSDALELGLEEKYRQKAEALVADNRSKPATQSSP
jgi:tetratricopeptide (TPR) repeat protein